mmetsp:Transcript_31350/g.100006  ORF Transcript_31350/g.100006 Transcript_31350/m.100006 type:complete len:427 (+) Transcript_31350:1316-2596(+)
MPYFSRCFSRSRMRLRNSCASCFHRAMSFCMFMACVSWRFTKSICFFVRSSSLMTFLLRMSRSRRRSSIFFLSTSLSRFSVSAFSCAVFSSSLSSLRSPSSSLRSSSRVRSFFRRASCIFRSLSRSAWCCWISSRRARRASSRCWFSCTYFWFFASSCSSFSSNFRFSSSFWRTRLSRRSSSFSASTTSCSTFLSSASSLRMLRCTAVSSSWCISFSMRRSFISCSSSSFLRFSASISCFFSATRCLISTIFSSEVVRSLSFFWSSFRRVAQIFCSISVFCCSMSRSFSSCSCCVLSCASWFSCSMLMPAPCSILAASSAISALRFAMSSVAWRSFSRDCSTSFCWVSISRRRLAMRCWSSAAVFIAVWTLCALALISALSSRIFFVSRFSDSWDRRSALKRFSYSALKGSTICAFAPESSCSVSW